MIGPFIGGFLYRGMGLAYLFMFLSLILLLVAPLTKLLVPEFSESYENQSLSEALIEE